MINISNLTITFGGRTLFENITFFVGKQDKIGLVGRNGAGKSTLFKLIQGTQRYDEGQVTLQPDLTVGHLQQELGTKQGVTIFEEAKTAFLEIEKLEKHIDEINHQLETRTDYETDSYLNLCDDLAQAEERLALLGGDQREKQIGTILKGLGFTESDFHEPIENFSGGWQMRVELAKILLQKPDVILLDEPTNHLDIVSIQWLERFLKNYPGAVILISHDRQFLDEVTNRTIEIANRTIYDYNVAYSAYKVQRAERMATLEAAYFNQQKQIADAERFIERFKAKATKAKQAQSKMKQLEKIDRIELDVEENIAMRFHFPPAPRSGTVLFEAENLKKQYDDHVVFSKAGFEIERGDKIAFVGKNGMGKSTLTKILMGLLDYEGYLKEGHNLIKGYFAQDNIASLAPKKTAFETIDDMATGDMRTKVRSLLGAFLFSGEDADKKVQVMSGGEKSRLSMAKLLLEQHNFLVLDEPTNHLDMQSKDVLKEALLKFDGTYVVVSHDREFLRGLATKVFEFKDGKVIVHLGGIDEFLAQYDAESVDEILAQENKPVSKKAAQKQQPKLSFEEQKELKRQRQKLERGLKDAEEEIEKIESRKKVFETRLSNGEVLSPEDYGKIRDLDKQLERQYANWENYTHKLEELA
ncbi:MAG: ABC-F family ATP-binding cassette domain-containing protein [Bacteroidetes bacterium]|nr:ABC-F family ATP-binding cassette domain-containing protein [Bacteroidota bacterium]